MSEFWSALPAGSAIWLTLQLATTTMLVLLALATPLAFWLSQTRSPIKPVIETLTALPLVLPATVLGFYLLIIMSPTSLIGGFWVSLTGETLTFSFSGLLVASLIYSLPFAVQPLQAAFESVGKEPIDAARVLGAGPFDRFFNVVAPLSKRGFLIAGVLSFAHTVGEFGTILMVGGAIPGRTETLSIAVYNRVETLQYGAAHSLSALLLLFSFAVLFFVYSLQNRSAKIGLFTRRQNR